MKKGPSLDILQEVSRQKREPAWALAFRTKAFDLFAKKPLPSWGPDLAALNFSDLTYYLKSAGKEAKSWQEVDTSIAAVFEGMGIPQAEREFLAGVKTQFESDVVYGSLREELQKQGVIFCSMEEAIQKHANLVKKYLGTVVSASDNKFAALNSAFFSGGSFVYVPRNVVVKKPLQTYFRINTAKTGQFERTLIIAEPGSSVHYIEGCTAPNFSSANLHAAVVEIVALEGAKVRYTTIQNWSKNVYNLVTKRAHVFKNAAVTWTDLNLGSAVTMKYPASLLLAEGATASLLYLAIVNRGQIIDSGGKMVHLAPNTYSNILSKSLSLDGGQSSFRGLVSLGKSAVRSLAKVSCQALLLDNKSRSDSYPKIINEEKTATVEHEAFISRLSSDQLLYLQSRGLKEAEATSLLALGFLEPVLKDVPLEYTLELNNLMAVVMENYYEEK